MSKSKYEYVRTYEDSSDHILLKDCYIVVRIDGQKFHKFTKRHNLLKPNDKRCLDLMNESAKHVIKCFFPNIVMAYGQSDEYSFLIRRMSDLYKRRQNKVQSLICSSFTSAFVYYWSQYFSSNELFTDRRPSTLSSSVVTLQYPPAFDSRCILYPNAKVVMDYFRWRQVDCHVNNLYNTVFYALTGQYTKYLISSSSSDSSYKITTCDKQVQPMTPKEATDRLSKTISSDKHEIMFTDYGINYNNELEQFKKGSIILLNINDDVLQQIKPKKKNWDQIREDIDVDLNQFIDVKHCDIIKDEFWDQNQSLLT
ncbi:uncharacterized protein LOC128956363 [Oppia nitens]|uniref:uncharacterized protein LOC128956363 n=1 Tax=Oppia nitens TaxID=1686743 RepID=UPI0023DA5D89|nr:uncharacterized protein LOC128956363 [Oppia nitens]